MIGGMVVKKLVALLFVAVFLFTGCYNSNPPQKMLDMFTDDSLVAEEEDSFCNGPANWNRSNSFSHKTTDFTGADTVWFGTFSPNEIITIEYSATVSKGDFKIVLVNSSDGVIETLWHSDDPVSEKQNFMHVVQQEGWYRIKIVGVHTNSKFDISVDTAQAT